MHKKALVLYGSKYGTTQAYAQWIATTLNCPCSPVDKLSTLNLSAFDLIIYGGGLYAGGILGLGKLKNQPVKALVLFTVGLSNPRETNYEPILQSSLKTLPITPLKTFHLRGGINYKKLSLPHRAAMAMVKKIRLDKKDPSQMTADDKAMAETYGDQVDFTSPATARPLVDFVNALGV